MIFDLAVAEDFFVSKKMHLGAARRRFSITCIGESLDAVLDFRPPTRHLALVESHRVFDAIAANHEACSHFDNPFTHDDDDAVEAAEDL